MITYAGIIRIRVMGLISAMVNTIAPLTSYLKVDANVRYFPLKCKYCCNNYGLLLRVLRPPYPLYADCSTRCMADVVQRV